MQKYPKLSCIIPYAYSQDLQRLEGLKHLLSCFNNQTFRNFEIIVVEHVNKNIVGRFPYQDLVDNYIKVVDSRHFNKSWLMNIGAKKARSDNLLFHDADALFGNTFLESIWNFIPKEHLFSCWSRYVLLCGKDNPLIRIHTPFTISCLVACWYCNRDYFFNEFGAYNEDYFGYGREDSDVWYRAKYLAKKRTPAYMDYPMVHWYHNWHPDNGANPLNRDDRHLNKILKITHSNPKQVIEKLVKNKNNLGNRISPFLIY